MMLHRLHPFGFSFFPLVLRSQGKTTSRSQIQKILRTYPKFAPLLNSRVPSNLIPVIWNDPVVRQIASIISKAPVSLFISSLELVLVSSPRTKNLQFLQRLKKPFDQRFRNQQFQRLMKNIHRISSITRHRLIFLQFKNNNVKNNNGNNYPLCVV